MIEDPATVMQHHYTVAKRLFDHLRFLRASASRAEHAKVIVITRNIKRKHTSADRRLEAQEDNDGAFERELPAVVHRGAMRCPRVGHPCPGKLYLVLIEMQNWAVIPCPAGKRDSKKNGSGSVKLVEGPDGVSNLKKSTTSTVFRDTTKI